MPSARSGRVADDDAVDTAGDLAQLVVAAVALDLVGVRVDREDLVAPLAEALVDDVAAVVLGLPGDAGDGDSLAGQELRCRVFDALHVKTSSYARTRGMLRREASTRIGLRTDRRCRELPILEAVPPQWGIAAPGGPCASLGE